MSLKPVAGEASVTFPFHTPATKLLVVIENALAGWVSSAAVLVKLVTVFPAASCAVTVTGNDTPVSLGDEIGLQANWLSAPAFT